MRANLLVLAVLVALSSADDALRQRVPVERELKKQSSKKTKSARGGSPDADAGDTPTHLPTYQPSKLPTHLPTTPTPVPTDEPPTHLPTHLPTTPTPVPTTESPTLLPTHLPSQFPNYVVRFLRLCVFASPHIYHTPLFSPPFPIPRVFNLTLTVRAKHSYKRPLFGASSSNRRKLCRQPYCCPHANI